MHGCEWEAAGCSCLWVSVYRKVTEQPLPRAHSCLFPSLHSQEILRPLPDGQPTCTCPFLFHGFTVALLKNPHQFQMIMHVVASSVIFPQGTFKHPEYHQWSVSQVKSLCAVENFKTWETTILKILERERKEIRFTSRHYNLCKGSWFDAD